MQWKVAGHVTPGSTEVPSESEEQGVDAQLCPGLQGSYYEPSRLTFWSTKSGIEVEIWSYQYTYDFNL